jgi:hypothetical protein
MNCTISPANKKNKRDKKLCGASRIVDIFVLLHVETTLRLTHLVDNCLITHTFSLLTVECLHLSKMIAHVEYRFSTPSYNMDLWR